MLAVHWVARVFIAFLFRMHDQLSFLNSFFVYFVVDLQIATLAVQSSVYAERSDSEMSALAYSSKRVLLLRLPATSR